MMLLQFPTTSASSMLHNKKNFLLALFILSSLWLQAQTTKVSELNQADLFLLDSKYTEAISWVDGELTKLKNPKASIVLENKKAEALIRLGQLEAANNLLRDLE